LVLHWTTSPKKYCISTGTLLRAVHKLRWQDFGFFWPPTLLRWHLLCYKLKIFSI
jgi:hypothetical protein